jgi:pimeloyl-ACP methyl ester carboxylesterase
MSFVIVNNHKTFYQVSGNGGRDILFVHGWAASGRMWLRTMWALRRQFRVWAVDLPGFGRSEAPDIDWYSTESYTDHLAAFCRKVGIRPYAVVGHSLGGRLAFDLGRRYPELVERLVAVSPVVTGRLSANLNLVMMGRVGQALTQFSRMVWPLAAAGVLSTYWAPNFLSPEGARRQVMDIRRASWEAAVGSLRSVANRDYSPRLAEVAQPALVIVGSRDYTIPPGDSVTAASLLPHGRLVMLDGVHHWPSDEDLPSFVYLLGAFLEKEPLEALV